MAKKQAKPSHKKKGGAQVKKESAPAPTSKSKVAKIKYI